MNLKDLMNNEYVWLLLSVCTSASLIFGVYTLIKGKRRKEIKYISSKYRVIRDGEGVIPELDIKYEDKTIQNLLITKYVIWNNGTEVIDKKDVVSTEPLKIVSKNEKTTVLNAQIIFQNENTNGFHIVNIESDGIEIEFDYMDSNEGCVVQVMHTGKSENLEMNGKIKGGKLKRMKNETDLKIFEKKEWKKLFIRMLVMMVVALTSIPPALSELLSGILVEKSINTILLNEIIFFLFFIVIEMEMLWEFTKGVYFYNIPSVFRKAMGYEQTDFEF